MNLLAFLDRHKGTAAILGGFCSMTAGATWWLATGGAAALITSMTALSKPEIAETLTGLPDYHGRVESSLAVLQAGQQEQQQAILQIRDMIEAMRRDSEQIVEWAPEHSQRLTDAVGGCHAGQKDCRVYFRGRLTQAGVGCNLVSERPKLILPDDREFPVTFQNGDDLLELPTTFETVEAVISIPEFIPPGLVGVVVWTVYADCPFAGQSTVDRKTFRLLVEIKSPE